MKTRSIITAGFIILLSTVFFTSNAQSTNPAIKVLPTTKEGIVKLLVVGATDEKVNVKFYDIDGLLQTDDINVSTDGFNKKYDVRQLMSRDLVMEITTEGASATYKLAKMKGKMTPYLVKKTTYTYPMVASNK